MLEEYLDCLRRLNISICKPNINLSTSKYQVINNKLFLPINIIKNIGASVVDTIVDVRGEGFLDYFDFVKRVNGNNNVGIKTIEVLIMSGCCDSFNVNRRTMIENLSDAITYSELSSDLDEMLVSVPTLKNFDEFSSNELVKSEKDLYGFYLSDHPVTKYNNIVKLINLHEYFDKTINLYVYVEELRKIKTKSNDDMAFIVCSDETELMDLIIFPNKVHLLKDIKVGDIIRVYGQVEKRYGKFQILLNDVKKVYE